MVSGDEFAVSGPADVDLDAVGDLRRPPDGAHRVPRVPLAESAMGRQLDACGFGVGAKIGDGRRPTPDARARAGVDVHTGAADGRRGE